MPVHIRPGTPADLPAALRLIQELATYEREPEAVVTTVESMTRDGFGPDKVFSFLVAEQPDGEIVGLALFFPTYSTWKGRTLFLDDLVVTEAARGQGIGQQLLDGVVAEARRQGASRVRWQVLDWNEPAIRFYERIGAHIRREWLDVMLVVDEQMSK